MTGVQTCALPICRRELERTLDSQAAGSAGLTTPAPCSSHLTAKLDTIIERYEQIFTNVTAGRTPNFAQMANVKLLLEDLKQTMAG